MEEPIIEIEHLTKRFVLMRNRYGIKSALLHIPRYLRDTMRPEYFTVLDDISLSVQRGEAIGLVGPNGSGKTTLLSVIGGVLKKYRGTCVTRGRISMMLALTSGFASELSGRENIILNGVLQGMSRREMLRRSDGIIDFAGLGRFIDSPVYQYSSGMQARLGFAIATAIDPEILLVDEVMAVGDDDFRKRCRVRMKELMSRQTTLVLVSHKAGDIMDYCGRVVELRQGRIVRDCPTAEYYRDKKCD